MKKLLLVTIIFSLLILTACTGNVSTPSSINNADTITTIVAETLSVVPSATPPPSPATALAPVIPTVLPRILYYQSIDANGKGQVFRLGKDGVTITQITNQPEGVNYFDVSLVDSSIAYQSNQQLFLINADGENRRLLIETQISSGPLWSPNGKIIAYETNGSVYIYEPETYSSTLILDGNGVGKYGLRGFSPDGTKLIVSVSESGTKVVKVYDFVSNQLLPFSLNTLNRISWVADSIQILVFGSFAGGSAEGITIPGLWRYNVESGYGNSLFPDTSVGDICIEAPTISPGGYLFYLYGTEHPCTNPSLSLIRRGSTEDVKLRSETFHVVDTLWAPNFSALVILQKDSSSNIPTNLIFVPIYSSSPVITLLSDASNFGWNPLRWGQP